MNERKGGWRGVRGGGRAPPGAREHDKTQDILLLTILTYLTLFLPLENLASSCHALTVRGSALTHPSWDRLALILAALASFDFSKATLSSSVKGLCAKRFACMHSMHESKKGGMEGGPGRGRAPPGAFDTLDFNALKS